MNHKPLIIMTMGDPAGIGPEIIAKTIDRGDLFQFCSPVVIGDAEVMKKQIGEMRLPLTVNIITSPARARGKKGILDILDLNLVDLATHAWGHPDVSCGTAVVAYIKKAVELALHQEAEAIVTAPINKAMMNAAGHHYAGHTELLADLTQAEEYGMMFVGGGLRVILTTIHVALKDVPGRITPSEVLKTLRLAQTAMRSFGIDKPRIGVAALNPHAGEGRLFGSEEEENILPAVIQARNEGIDASDPLPADTLFHKAYQQQFDIVVAMYHDQGLAPLKMLAFGNAVNVTVGLPLIRTSVDHGTAYDIAGKGVADPASLFEAVKLAATLASFKKSSSRTGS
jgi:4-hydroxythreonine-4-phosphate dehydrogenase